MADPGELVQGVFSLVVSVSVLGLILITIRGGDIAELASVLADFLPALVVLLIVLFFILKAAENV